MRFFLALCLCMFVAVSSLQVARAATIKVENAWARSTAPGLPTGVVYFTITNSGTTDDTLVSIATPVAQAQLHETSNTNGIMTMRPLKDVIIPAGAHVAFEAGGKHVMLVGLKAPLVAGKTFPLTLNFKNAGSVDVLIAIQDKAPNAMGMDGMKMDGMDVNGMQH